MNNKKRNRKGFTIVELSIVIAVIAILAVAMIPVFGGIIGDSKDANIKQNLKNAYTSYSLAAVEAEVDAEEQINVLYDGKCYKVKNGVAVTKGDGDFDTVTIAPDVKAFCAQHTKEAKYVAAVGDEAAHWDCGCK